MTAWLKGNNKPNRQMLDYAASDDPGCERGYNPSLCRMRHTVARLKEARGMRHEYEPCAYCPKFLAPAEETTPAATQPEPQKPVEQHQATPEKPKEAEKMKKTHKCKCGEPITAVRAKSSGKCKTCYHKDYNATYKRNTDQSENAPPPAPKTGAEPKQAPKDFRDMTASEVCRAYGIQSCHNCDDESCGDNLNRIEPATNTIHASPPPEKTEPETSWQAKSIAELPISLRELQRIAHENAVQKGWHETRRSDGEMICLMHSELSEALEELRNGKAPSEVYFKDQKPEGVPIELADVVIRIFDFCGLHNINLQSAIVTKMLYNQTRPYRHGGKKL